MGEHRVHLAIRNELADLALLSDALEQFCVRHGVTSKTRGQLQVALDEIVSNIIKYAWPDGGAHKIELFISAVTDGIKLELVDDGQAFDPLAVKAPAQPTAGSRPRPGGLGLHMVHQLVDGIDYVRRRGRNHTTLTKQCAVSVSSRRSR